MIGFGVLDYLRKILKHGINLHGEVSNWLGQVLTILRENLIKSHETSCNLSTKDKNNIDIPKTYNLIKLIVEKADFTAEVSEQYCLLFNDILNDINNINIKDISVINQQLTKLTVLINHFVIEMLLQSNEFDIRQLSDVKYIIVSNKIGYNISLCNNPNNTISALKSVLKDDTCNVIQSIEYLIAIHTNCINTICNRFAITPNLPWLDTKPTFIQTYEDFPNLGKNFTKADIAHRNNKGIEDLSNDILDCYSLLLTYSDVSNFDNTLNKVNEYISNLPTNSDTESILNELNLKIIKVKENIILFSRDIVKNDCDSSFIHENTIGIYNKYMLQLKYFMLDHLLDAKVIENYTIDNVPLLGCELAGITYPPNDITEPGVTYEYYLDSETMIASILKGIGNSDYNEFIDTVHQLTHIVYDTYTKIDTHSRYYVGTDIEFNNYE